MPEFALLSILATFISEVIGAHLESGFILGDRRGRFGYNRFATMALFVSPLGSLLAIRGLELLQTQPTSDKHFESGAL